MKIGHPNGSEIERTRESTKLLNMKNGEGLGKIYLKDDVFLLAVIFEIFMKVSKKKFGINTLLCVSLPGYTWEFGLKFTNFKLEALQDKEIILTLENNTRGFISSVIGDRYVNSHRKKRSCILMLITYMVML